MNMDGYATRRKRRGDTCANTFEIDGLIFARELLEDFVEHVLDLGGVDSCGRDLHCYAACPKGLGFESVVGEFFGNVTEDCLLCGGQFKDQRHQQTLAFDS